MKKTTTKDWRDELQEGWGGCYADGAPNMDAVEEFIETLLTTQKKEIIEEIKKTFDPDGCECDNCDRWRKYSRKNLFLIQK